MSLKDDINRMVEPPQPEKKLPAAILPSAIRDKTGLERRAAGQVSGEIVTVKSTDGLFTFTVQVVKA